MLPLVAVPVLRAKFINALFSVVLFMGVIDFQKDSYE